MYLSPCLCLDLHIHVFKALFGCYAQCFLQLYISCWFLFLVLWLLGRVQIQIQWSRPTSIHPSFSIKVLDYFPLCMCFVYSFPCVYGQFHACLLRSRPFPCSPPFSLCRFVLVGLWGYFVCLVASVPFGGLFGCNHVWEYISVMFGLLATCLSILCLALHVKVSHVSPFVCLTTCIPFPFV